MYIATKIVLVKKVQGRDFSTDTSGDNYKEAVRNDRRIYSKAVPVIFGGTGVTLIIASVDFSKKTLMVIVCILLYFGGIHLFAQSRLLIYCKLRFQSFNFNMKGHLYPWGSGDRLENKSLQYR